MRRALLLAAAALALAGVPLAGSDYLVDLTTEIAIYVLFATSLNVLVGYAGNVSFGHAAYFALGGYSCAILLTTLSLIHISEPTRRTPISYAVFCLKKKK